MNAARRREYAEECLAELWRQLAFPAGLEPPVISMRVRDWHRSCGQNAACMNGFFQAPLPLATFGVRFTAAVCYQCNSIWISYHQRTRQQIRQSIRHELLHLRHPEWSELLVQVANEER